MPRKKEYNEELVIDKALNLFWSHGYERTSMQMLEKEMGINKFSIYSSFGSKNGVLLESIKEYQRRLNTLLNLIKASTNGAEAIKQYFYDFVEFTKENQIGKGCLVTSTMNELGSSADEQLQQEAFKFSSGMREAFGNSLRQDTDKTVEQIEQQTDYLIMALMGLTFATRMFNKSQLENYIEHTFNNL